MATPSLRTTIDISSRLVCLSLTRWLNLTGYDIHQLLRHDDDFLDRFARGEFFNLGARQSRFLDLVFAGVRRHDELVAQLAVDLHRNLEGGLDEQRGIELWPGRVG